MTPIVDLLSPEIRADPFPTYARMRELWPVCQIQPGGFWAVSRYDDVSLVLKDFRLFSSTGFQQMLEPPWVLCNPMAHSMLAMDPPAHTRLRKLVTQAFSASALARVTPLIGALAEQFTNAIAERGEDDFVAGFASPLPAHVICHFLGLDPALSTTFKRWVDDLAGITPMPLSDAHARSVLTTLKEMQAHFVQILALRRNNPGADLVSQLLQAEVEGASLSQNELIAFLVLLLAGGIDTTAHLLSKTMIVLTDRPDLHERLRDDPELIPAFINELIRYEPPVHAVFRQATQDVEIAGTTIPRGSFVIALVASANRDPARFPAPDTFDLERTGPQGLAFGAGPHVCIGSLLARLEGKSALTALLQRFVRFERVHKDIDWHHTLLIRGPASLPLRFTAA
jgi:cytochrome P450